MAMLSNLLNQHITEAECAVRSVDRATDPFYLYLDPSRAIGADRHNQSMAVSMVPRLLLLVAMMATEVIPASYDLSN